MEKQTASTLPSSSLPPPCLGPPDTLPVHILCSLQPGSHSSLPAVTTQSRGATTQSWLLLLSPSCFTHDMRPRTPFLQWLWLMWDEG